MKIPPKFFLHTVIFFFIIFSHPAITQEQRWGKRIDKGILQNSSIDEASGIACSRRNPGILWTHNDSGDKSRIFAIGVDGSYLGEFILEGVKARDWEDIAIGPGPEDGESYLYIGEIGDNMGRHPDKAIYRFPEPVIDSTGLHSQGSITNFDVISFRYPDGPRDAETVIVDPLTRDIYIVSKREKNVRVYRASWPQPTDREYELEFLTTIDITAINGGDVSFSGTGILLKNYTTLYYWPRNPDLPLWRAFEQPPRLLPYTMEPQGEAVCWDSAGTGYYTLSEKRGSSPVHLYYYPLSPPGKQ